MSTVETQKQIYTPPFFFDNDQSGFSGPEDPRWLLLNEDEKLKLIQKLTDIEYLVRSKRSAKIMWCEG